jgi:hypothetical protein
MLERGVLERRALGLPEFVQQIGRRGLVVGDRPEDTVD